MVKVQPKNRAISSIQGCTEEDEKMLRRCIDSLCSIEKNHLAIQLGVPLNIPEKQFENLIFSQVLIAASNSDLQNRSPYWSPAVVLALAQSGQLKSVLSDSENLFDVESKHGDTIQHRENYILACALRSSQNSLLTALETSKKLQEALAESERHRKESVEAETLLRERVHDLEKESSRIQSALDHSDRRLEMSDRLSQVLNNRISELEQELLSSRNRYNTTLAKLQRYEEVLGCGAVDYPDLYELDDIPSAVAGVKLEAKAVTLEKVSTTLEECDLPHALSALPLEECRRPANDLDRQRRVDAWVQACSMEQMEYTFQPDIEGSQSTSYSYQSLDWAESPGMDALSERRPAGSPPPRRFGAEEELEGGCGDDGHGGHGQLDGTVCKRERGRGAGPHAAAHGGACEAGGRRGGGGGDHRELPAGLSQGGRRGGSLELAAAARVPVPTPLGLREPLVRANPGRHLGGGSAAGGSSGAGLLAGPIGRLFGLGGGSAAAAGGGAARPSRIATFDA